MSMNDGLPRCMAGTSSRKSDAKVTASVNCERRVAKEQVASGITDSAAERESATTVSNYLRAEE